MPQITLRTKNEQLYYSVAIATGINCLVLVSSRGVGKTVLPTVLPTCKKMSRSNHNSKLKVNIFINLQDFKRRLWLSFYYFKSS